MTTPCDRCVELEAQVEALLDELHDVKVALADVGAVREAVAHQRHPSNLPVGAPTGTCDWGNCDAIAERWRWSHDVGEWLPVCWPHADLPRAPKCATCGDTKIIESGVNGWVRPNESTLVRPCSDCAGPDRSTQDDAPPHGIRRPTLHLIGGEK